LALLTKTVPFAEPSAKKFFALPESSCEIALICRNKLSRFGENAPTPDVALLARQIAFRLVTEAVGEHDTVVGRDRVVDQGLRTLGGCRVVVDRNRGREILRDGGGAEQRAERT